MHRTPKGALLFCFDPGLIAQSGTETLSLISRTEVKSLELTESP